MFDIYTIIFLALAIFIFIRLRSVLGQRTGRERPPYDPYSARDARAPASDKVVNLPTRNAESVARPAEPAPDRWKGIADEGSAVATGLDAIAAVDRSFDAKHFVTGGRQAYEMIVGAFAAGDRKSLKGLLSREVYEGFEAAIRDREAKGETVENKFVSLDTADIIGAELRGNTQGKCKSAEKLGKRLRRRYQRQAQRQEIAPPGRAPAEGKLAEVDRLQD